MKKTVAELDEESRGLLKRVLEGLAYRELGLFNVRGHGLKFLNEIDDKLKLVGELELALRQFREIERMYSVLGHKGVVSLVRDKIERIPYPTSRMELALSLFVAEQASRASMSAYHDSSCIELEAFCRRRMESLPSRELPEDPLFVEFCAEPGNRAHAQQLFNRWLAIGLVALGRPGTRGDARAVALGLRGKHTAAIAREFLDELGPFLARTGLALPPAATLGVELPPG